MILPSFSPMLYIPHGIRDISFYEKAFGAIEMQRWCNDDESIHVAELQLGEALFHVHEENQEKGQFEPNNRPGITTVLGLFVEDVDVVMASALSAGAILVMAAQDFDYGYRQGEIRDPFGHIWSIQKKDDLKT
jgi:PhnB protein